MTDWTHFVNQLPLLLVGIPFCGMLTIGLVRLIGREHLPRTFLLNGMLTFGCALAILFQFHYGSARTRLSPAESFQSVIVLFDSEHSPGFRFGIDGCSLPLILLVSALPLFVYRVWNPLETERHVAAAPRRPEMTCGRAALLLLLQVLLLIFLAALDRRVQFVTLLLSTFVLLLELAISLPAGRRNLLAGWQRQLLLSDFLIVGGMLATLTPLIRLAGMGINPDSLFDLVRLLAAAELLQDRELTDYIRLMSTVTGAQLLMLVGISIRFGAFPCSRAMRTMWEQTAPWQQLLVWAHGPLLGTAVLLRELQAFPVAAYHVIAYLKYVWLIGLFASAATVRLSTGRRREAGVLVYYSSLLFLSSVGPNPVSLAGSFLLLLAIGLRLSVADNDRGTSFAMRSVRSCSRFLISAGTICTMLGHWQGLGAGARGLGFSLSLGLSLLILGAAGRKDSGRERRTDSSLIPRSPRSPAPGPGEPPVWDVSPPPVSPPVVSRWQASIRSAGLIVVLCVLLMLPNFLWQRIRWDLEKIEFPNGTFSLTEREDRP